MYIRIKKSTYHVAKQYISSRCLEKRPAPHMIETCTLDHYPYKYRRTIFSSSPDASPRDRLALFLASTSLMDLLKAVGMVALGMATYYIWTEKSWAIDFFLSVVICQLFDMAIDMFEQSSTSASIYDYNFAF
ncbi:MAG: hypothetical protein HKN87_06215 [Saprospiraceae bacterium]|nr:hypothetical protein [Saprospiraceae bacterium]